MMGSMILKTVCALMCVGALWMSTGAALADSIIAPGAKLEKVADGYDFTEGASCDAQGNAYFTDQPNNKLLKYGIDGKISVVMEPAGRSNGTCFDNKGHIWTCADEKNELWCIDLHGKEMKVVRVIKGYNGKLLNGPNDVWLRPDGGLYVTDPYYKRPYWNRGPMEQDCQAVYYLAPNHNEFVRVVGDLKQPNGIVGTPDGKTLYISDIGDNKTYVYKVNPDGKLTDKKLFCSLGSDGMTMDNEGNVYLTGKGVTVFDKHGKQIEHVPVPEDWTGNICFTGVDRHTLFITASKGVYTLKMRVKGVGSQ